MAPVECTGTVYAPPYCRQYPLERIFHAMTPVRLRLRDLRAAKGLTQEELATIAQVRQATISDIENGNTDGVKFAVLERLADALGCEPGELVERVKPKRKK